MFLKQISTQNLIEVLSLEELWDPFIVDITGRSHAGEELQDPETYNKTELVFPSGEPLPQCWINPHYRDETPRQPKPLIATS